MNSKTKIEPKKPYVSPYLQSLPSLQFKTKPRTTTSSVGSSKPTNTKKTPSNLGLHVNGKSQSPKISHDLSVLSKGNLEKLQLAMRQLSFDSNPKLHIKGSQQGSKAMVTGGAKGKSKKQLPTPKSIQKEMEKTSSNDYNNNLSSNIAKPIDELELSVKPVKSILKPVRPEGSFNDGQIGQPEWRKFLLRLSGAGESSEKASAKISSDGKRPLKKHVKFLNKVLIHYVPYESRGSTEWQYNLMMARESVMPSLRTDLTDPRISSLMSDLGLQNSPFIGFPSEVLQSSMPNSRLLRRQSYF